jgi:hypothetical protein
VDYILLYGKLMSLRSLYDYCSPFHLTCPCHYSMVDEQKVSGSDVCVFEMTERAGGRLMSMRGLGPESDLTVDAGGYRTVSVARIKKYCRSILIILIVAFCT